MDGRRRLWSLALSTILLVQTPAVLADSGGGVSPEPIESETYAGSGTRPNLSGYRNATPNATSTEYDLDELSASEREQLFGFSHALSPPTSIGHRRAVADPAALLPSAPADPNLPETPALAVSAFPRPSVVPLPSVLHSPNFGVGLGDEPTLPLPEFEWVTTVTTPQLCFLTLNPATGDGCSIGIFSLPNLVFYKDGPDPDLGDGIPDLIWRLDLCGEECWALTVQAGNDQLGAKRVPVEISVYWEGDQSFSNSRVVAQEAFFSTLGTGRPNPDSITISSSILSTATSASISLQVSAAGATSPMTISAGSGIGEDFVPIFGRRLTLFYEDDLPSISSASVTFTNILTRTFSASYTGASVGLTIDAEIVGGSWRDAAKAVIRKAPTTWSLSSDWGPGGETVSVSGSAGASSLSLHRSSWDGAQSKLWLIGQLSRPGAQYSMTRSACSVAIEPGSGVTGSDIEWRSGATAKALPTVPGVISENGGFAFKALGVKSISMNSGCGGLRSRLDATFAAPLTDFVARLKSSPHDFVFEARNEGGAGMPARLIFETDLQSATLSSSSSRVGRLQFCNTDALYCPHNGLGNENVTIRNGDSSGVAGRLTGITSLSVSASAEAYTISASRQGVDKRVDFDFASPEAGLSLRVMNAPKTLAFSTDFDSHTSYANTDAMSEFALRSFGSAGGQYIYLTGVPAGSAFVDVTHSARYEISSTVEISVAHACFLSEGLPSPTCGDTIPTDFTYVISEELFATRLRGLRRVISENDIDYHRVSMTAAAGWAHFTGYESETAVLNAETCARPASASFWFEAVGASRYFEFAGPTPCVRGASFAADGGLTSYFDASGVVDYVAARIRLEDATGGPTAEFFAGEAVDYLLATAQSATGVLRSATFCGLEIDSASVAWTTDLSEISGIVEDGHSIGRLQFVLSGDLNTGCGGSLSESTVVFREELGKPTLLWADLLGAKGFHFRLRPSAPLVSLASDLKANVVAYGIDPLGVFSLVMWGAPTNFAYSLASTERATWTASEQAVELETTAAIGPRVFYLHLDGIPTSVEARVVPSSRQLVISSSSTITSAVAWITRSSAPKAVYLYGIGVGAPSLTLEWSANKDTLTATSTGTIGQLEFSVDYPQGGISLPVDTGLIRVRTSALDYVALKASGLRTSSWKIEEGRLSMDMRTNGGTGSTIFEAHYSAPGALSYTRVTFVPNGRLTLSTDLDSRLTLRSPTCIHELLVQAQLPQSGYYFAATDVCPLSFLFDPSSRAQSADFTSTLGTANRIEGYFMNTTIGGVSGSGLRYLTLVADRVPSDIAVTVMAEAGHYALDFGARSVENLRVHASTNGESRLRPGNFLDIRQEGTRWEMDMGAKGLQRGAMSVTGDRKTISVALADSQPGIFVWERDGRRTWATLSSMPSQVFVELSAADDEEVHYSASTRVGSIEALTTEFQDFWNDFIFLALTDAPTAFDVWMARGNPGNFTFRAADLTGVTVAAVAGPWRTEIHLAVKELEGSWESDDGFASLVLHTGNLWVVGEAWVIYELAAGTATGFHASGGVVGGLLVTYPPPVVWGLPYFGSAELELCAWHPSFGELCAAPPDIPFEE